MRTPTPDHGSTARYYRGCRCPACKQARAEYALAWREARRPPPGPATPVIRVPVPDPPVSAELVSAFCSLPAAEQGHWESLADLMLGDDLEQPRRLRQAVRLWDGEVLAAVRLRNHPVVH
jgi:hypothetical protein